MFGTLVSFHTVLENHYWRYVDIKLIVASIVNKDLSH